MDLEKRIRAAKKTSIETNCLGTAFFISGVSSKDGIVKPKSAYYEVLRFLTPLRKPEEGSIIVLHQVDRITEFNEAIHAGAITSTNPVRIVHRIGINGNIVENEYLERFRDYLRDQRNHFGKEFRNYLRYYSSIPLELIPFL